MAKQRKGRLVGKTHLQVLVVISKLEASWLMELRPRAVKGAYISVLAPTPVLLKLTQAHCSTALPLKYSNTILQANADIPLIERSVALAFDLACPQAPNIDLASRRPVPRKNLLNRSRVSPKAHCLLLLVGQCD